VITEGMNDETVMSFVDNERIHYVYYIILLKDVPIDTLHVSVVPNEIVDSILQKIMAEHFDLFTGVDKYCINILDSMNKENLTRLLGSWNTNATPGITALNEENQLQLFDSWSTDVTWGTQSAPIVVLIAKSAIQSKYHH
jgi:hypothetical protein